MPLRLEDINMDVPATGDEKEITLLRARMTMVWAWAQMILKAFDALLHHGINFRNLPAYKDTTLLEEGMELPPELAQAKWITWMGRIEKDIVAAIRRKSFRPVK